MLCYQHLMILILQVFGADAVLVFTHTQVEPTTKNTSCSTAVRWCLLIIKCILISSIQVYEIMYIFYTVKFGGKVVVVVGLVVQIYSFRAGAVTDNDKGDSDRVATWRANHHNCTWGKQCQVLVLYGLSVVMMAWYKAERKTEIKVSEIVVKDS